MPDQIFEVGPVDTPYVYTVAGRGVVIPRDFQAVYDGSGAGGDYVPAVVLKSQAGHVIARAILQQTIPAGDDAEVSWFRGVKAGGGGGTASAFKYLHVVAGSPAPPVDPMTIVGFATNDPANYVQTDASHWTVPGVPQDLQILLIPTTNITTNGTIVGGAQNTSGMALTSTIGTGVFTNGAPNHWFLQSGFEIGLTWHLLISGTDTHLWGVHAWFFYVG